MHDRSTGLHGMHALCVLMQDCNAMGAQETSHYRGTRGKWGAV